jgi:hypothetical protein
MLSFLLPCNHYARLCFSDEDVLAESRGHVFLGLATLCVSNPVTKRRRLTLPRPKLPLNDRAPQPYMMDQCHCWAGLACCQRCVTRNLQNPQARLVFCAFSLFGEGQNAACHGRFLRGSRTFPQSQVCFGSAGADKQLEEHLVELDAFSYEYAD